MMAESFRHSTTTVTSALRLAGRPAFPAGMWRGAELSFVRDMNWIKKLFGIGSNPKPIRGALVDDAMIRHALHVCLEHTKPELSEKEFEELFSEVLKSERSKRPDAARIINAFCKAHNIRSYVCRLPQ